MVIKAQLLHQSISDNKKCNQHIYSEYKLGSILSALHLWIHYIGKILPKLPLNVRMRSISLYQRRVVHTFILNPLSPRYRRYINSYSIMDIFHLLLKYSGKSSFWRDWKVATVQRNSYSSLLFINNDTSIRHL